MTTLYLWRAWSANRERICDSGIAQADSEDKARDIARMCLGGPHREDVVEFQVEAIRQRFVYVDSHDVEALLCAQAAALAIAELPSAKVNAVYQARVADALERIKRIATDSMMLSPVAQEAMAQAVAKEMERLS